MSIEEERWARHVERKAALGDPNTQWAAPAERTNAAAPSLVDALKALRDSLTPEERQALLAEVDSLYEADPSDIAAAEARGEARSRADLAKLWDATGIPRDADCDVDFVTGAILQMVDRSRQHRAEVARLYREIADAEARGRRWAVEALRRTIRNQSSWLWFELGETALETVAAYLESCATVQGDQ